jgi:hypothetical protein
MCGEEILEVSVVQSSQHLSSEVPIFGHHFDDIIVVLDGKNLNLLGMWLWAF